MIQALDAAMKDNETYQCHFLNALSIEAGVAAAKAAPGAGKANRAPPARDPLPLPPILSTAPGVATYGAPGANAKQEVCFKWQADKCTTPNCP